MSEEQKPKSPIQSQAIDGVEEKFNHGLALHQQGRLAEAERIYREVLRQQPQHFDALHLLGVIALQAGQTQRGIELISKAVALNPNVAAAYCNLGKGLNDLQRHEEALANYDKAIALQPDYAQAYYNRGIALVDLKHHEEALASYDRAIALKPDHAEAYNNRGNVLTALSRYEHALASCNKAIALKPDFAAAYYNRGDALNGLKRPEEALASYDTAIALKPDYAEAYNSRGATLINLQRFEEALASLDKAIAIKSNFAEAYNSRGVALINLQRLVEALASVENAIALAPDYAQAHNNRGIVFNILKRPEEALASFYKAFALMPDCEYLYGVLLHTKMMICDWSNFENEVAQLGKKIKCGEKAALPFPVLSISGSLELQRRAAEIWTRAYPMDHTSTIPKRPRRERIRVAYLSGDFRDHAAAYLLVGLFEQHNRKRFETVAISFGPDDQSEMRARLRNSFDQFLDVKDRSDSDVAAIIQGLEVDIAVDLMGYTAYSRPGIVAHRPSPIQVSFLGYPGTMGADYIDYLVADQIVIPELSRPYYAEKIVYLPNSYYPNSYQINDSTRLVAGRAFTRTGFGLPQKGFVFCCFNNNYKITPDVFDCWMRVLRQVDGSVLWLLEDNAGAAANLRKEAKARMINPERLVFAERMSLHDHITRHTLADLFLDTLPYNAHTTACDALWTGLPVLTRIGDAFAGRVAASLLNAVGLPELTVSTAQAYEDLAIEFATHHDKLEAIKRRLAKNRLSKPLFDTKLFSKHIEAAYTAMYERYQADLAPDHIFVQ